MAVPFTQTTRALHADSERTAHLVWSGAGLLLLVWIAWICLASVTLVEVSATARLEIHAAPHPIVAPVAGQVLSTHLMIGESVHAGDILAELDATTEQLLVVEAETQLATLDGKTRHLQAELVARQQARSEELGAAAAATEVARTHSDEAVAAFEFADLRARRLAELAAAGGATTAEAGKAEAEVRALAATQRGWVSEVLRLQLDAQARDHRNEAEIEGLNDELAALGGEVESTRRAIAVARQDVERRRIRATVDGRIGDVAAIQAGGYLMAGDRVATVLPEGELVVVAQFPAARSLGRIRPGQSALLRLDGFDWAQYGAVSAVVSTVAGELRDGMVRVELAIDAASAPRISLQHGQPGTVEIEVEHLSPATLVLRSAGLLLAGPLRETAVAEPGR